MLLMVSRGPCFDRTEGSCRTRLAVTVVWWVRGFRAENGDVMTGSVCDSER